MFRSTKKRKIQNSKRSFRSSLSEKDDDNDAADGDRKLSEVATGDTNENDEDEDPTVVIRRKTKDKKRLKRSGIVVRSFNEDEEDGHDSRRQNGDADDKSSRKSKKKRKRERKGGGLGFGGGIVGPASAGSGGAEDENEGALGAAITDENKYEESATANSTSNSLYGKEALEALRAEQQNRPTSDNDTVKDENAATASSEDLPTSQISSSLPAYIPLVDGGKRTEPTILTGEEALDFHKDNNNESDDINHKKTKSDDPMAIDGDHFQSIANESTDDWEEQVVRRAGLTKLQHQEVGAKSSPEANNTKAPPTREISSFGNIPSLSTLKKQLQSTVSNLKLQAEDLSNATMRRQADLAQTQADLQRHKQSLEDSGSACDYYQQLRLDVTSHVGALRDLQQKLKPIFDAMLELLLSQWSIREQRIREWQDDVGSILNDNELLDRTIGRQHQYPNQSTERIVDEFGRDVQSQFARQREKRYHERIERTTQSFKDNKVGSTSDDAAYFTRIHETFINSFWVNSQDVQDWNERYLALKEALRVALDDLDDEYTSMGRLLDVFRGWRKEKPEEYYQCYANLSLGDLSSILVLVDFFRSSWLETVATATDDAARNQNSQNDVAMLFSWMEQLESYQNEDSRANRGEVEVVGRTLEKSILPFILKLAEHSQFLDIGSPAGLLMSQCITRIVHELQGGSATNSTVLDKLKTTLNDAVSKTLDGISLMIVKGDGSDKPRGSENEREQILYAVATSRGAQIDYVKTLLVTLLKYWVPVMQLLRSNSSSSSSVNESRIDEKYIVNILDFISSKFLFVISSIPDRQKAALLFDPVWLLLKTQYEDWLNSPQFFMQAAPIRAAAIAYGSQTS